MATTQIDTNQIGTAVEAGETVAARQLREEVERGLQQPLAEAVRTLQRLALAQIGPDAPVLDPHLLVRARSLAHGLQQVVEEMVSDGTASGVIDSREPQETILVRTAIENAVAVRADMLGGRNVVVRGADRTAITTSPQRFHELLLAVLDAASETTGGDMRLVLARSRGELLMNFERLDVSGPALDQVRRVARTLGGTADRARGAGTPGVAIWLPQQRKSDVEVL
jgi:hypothetical protein